ATLSYAGVIADAAGGGGGTLTKSGAGTLSLTGVSTYTGGTTITAGSLELSGSSQLGGGVYAGDIANDGTLAVATSANQTLSGVISGTGSLTKSGTGTLTLAGANTFSGPTALTQGTLVVAAGGSLAGSAVAVGNSTTLAGAGGVGDTTVSFGGTLAPGVAGAGTLTLSSLTLGEFAFDSSTIAMPVSGSGTLDSRLAVTGDLTANGGASSVTFALGSNLSLLDSGTYTLVSYGGSQLADVSAFTFTGTQGGRQTVSLENGTQSIDLLVGNAFLTWSGAEGPGWATTDNWILSSDSQPTTFLSSDTVVFDDSGTSGAVELTSSVSPTTVTFSGDTLDYTLSSTGGAQIISGNLLKTGAATVTIDASNSYFGGTTVSAGTLVVNAIDGLGTGAVSVSGGLVQLNAASNSAGGVTISGGGVRVADDSALGFGTVTLAGGTLAASGSDPRTLSNTLTVTADSTLGDATDNG
ncbi:MAG: autotransporter-associated beta strand repeat-containing protein, partial [Pirellulales bacterium]|nr:autotransporter-associated beta strand repeat-containing protein [Pirellulales bacterium]